MKISIELEVDGEVIYQEDITNAEVEVRLFLLSALARSKYKKKEWYIFKRISKGIKGNRRINVDMDNFESMRNSGMTIKEIVKKMGISIDTLYDRRRELGLWEKREQLDMKEVYRLSKEGMSHIEIGKRFKVSRSTIGHKLIAYRKSITNEQTN